MSCDHGLLRNGVLALGDEAVNAVLSQSVNNNLLYSEGFTLYTGSWEKRGSCTLEPPPTEFKQGSKGP